MSRGFTATPLLATVEKAAAIWMGVTLMPCPIGMLAIEVPDQLLAGGTKPATSPGKSTPVGLAKPKASIHLSRRSLPILMPIFTAPTLLDHCRISRTEYLGARDPAVVEQRGRRE